MILLAPISKLGSVHIQSCKVFNSLIGMKEFLLSIDSKWNAFSICPEAYSLELDGITKHSDDWHRTFVYPFTYNSRHRE